MSNDLKTVGLSFKADGAVDFKKSLSEVNNAVNENRSAFKLAKSEWDKSTSSAEKLRVTQEYLQNQTEAYTAKVDRLTEILKAQENAEVRDEAAISKTRQQLDNALKPVGMVNLRIIDHKTAHYFLSAGTYTITLVSFENVENVTISAVNADWKTLASVTPGRPSKTFSVDANTIVGCYFVPKDVNATGYLQVQLELGTTATSYEPYTEQSVQLPYTLNAIPVASGGNVTIDGQQYVADYVDVERGKVVRMCGREAFNTKNGEINEEYRLSIHIGVPGKEGDKECIFSTFKWTSWTTCVSGTSLYIKNIKKPNNELYTAQELKELSIDFDVIYQLLEQQETDLTPEQTQALKELVTYYPVTNISVNSEQLDGYTVFNYPISMKNGWDYVKKQLNDNRDYIYDMDIQSAEAYVNSEYAVALAELEV